MAAAKNFYDAVLVGLDLTTLVAGALLAKRGFRVLVVGQGRPWPSYQLSGLSLPRGPFSLEAPGSPVLARAFSELALKPLVQRRTHALAPALQLVLPRHRLDLGGDPAMLGAELAREFPEARTAALARLAHAADASAALDPLLAEDLSWPPDGFFERRAFSRALDRAPLGDDGDFTSELDRQHPLARAFAAIPSFGDAGALASSSSARGARLLDARLRAASLEEGLSGLYELLCDSIRTHNGSLRLSERVDRLAPTHGAVERLRLLPSDEEIGCHYVLWGLSADALARHLREPAQLAPLFAEYGEPTPAAYRYVLNLVVDGDALPEGLSRDVLLYGERPLWIEAQRIRAGEHALLSVEAMLDARALEADPTLLASQRERVLAELALLSPFFARHLSLCDSPHDGRPPEGPAASEVATLDALSRRGPDTMQAVYAYPQTRIHGCCALPLRTPIERLLLCNAQVVPGLGLEGRFITAWSAARLVTRALGRAWMNRGRWTKVEL
ncbi:MAG: hypothetical protein ABW252_21155 [Polyangiales bacterium]